MNSLRLMLVLWSCLGGTVVFAASLYVVQDNPTPVVPYASWQSAAATIQDAVDAASAGDEVVVSNGVYSTGGRVVTGLLTNRVYINKAILVRSLNGPAGTVIEGYQMPGVTNGDSAIRCVFLTNNAQLVGFTIRKGATRGIRLLNSLDATGAGIIGQGVVSNCIVTGNAAHLDAGGLCARFPGLKVYSSSINNNWAMTGGGGGVAGCDVISSTISSNFAKAGGGGAWHGTLTNCQILGNKASNGGGASQATLVNCVLRWNSAVFSPSLGGGEGGGVYQGGIYNCTVVQNSASSRGGGTSYTYPTRNSIVYYNTATDADNGTANCCVPSAPADDVRNFSSAPLFVNLAAGDLRLQPGSPCINAGFAAAVATMVDMDGNPRLVGGSVDVGAYEYQSPESAISYAFLQKYGLPTDGSADFVDSDLDGKNNWEEWIAGTDPTNNASVLKMLPLTRNGSNWVVRWPGIVGRGYFTERATNHTGSPQFSALHTNPFWFVSVNGQIVSFTDTNAPSSGALYRLRVQQN